GVAATHRPDRSAGLDALDAALTGGKDAIMLRPWTVAKVASLPAVGGGPERAKEIVEGTGRNPRRPHDPAGARPRPTPPPSAGGAVPAAVVQAVRAELDVLSPEARRVATALATGEPVKAPAAVLAALVSGALVTPDGTIIPLVSAALSTLGDAEVAAEAPQTL